MSSFLVLIVILSVVGICYFTVTRIKVLSDRLLVAKIRDFQNTIKVHWILTLGVLLSSKPFYVATLHEYSKDHEVLDTYIVKQNSIPNESLKLWRAMNGSVYFSKISKNMFDREVKWTPRDFSEKYNCKVMTNYGTIIIVSDTCQVNGSVEIFKNPFTLEYSLERQKKHMPEKTFLESIPKSFKGVFMSDEKMKKLFTEK